MYNFINVFFFCLFDKKINLKRKTNFFNLCIFSKKVFVDVKCALFMSNSSKRLEIRLKEREDEYTCYKQFHILVGTFNVNNRQAPSNILLEEWLSQVTTKEENKQNYIPDIIAVGFQEIDTSSGAFIYDDKKKEDDWEQLVRKTIQSCYETNHKEENIQFELLNRVRLMGKDNSSFTLRLTKEHIQWVHSLLATSYGRFTGFFIQSRVLLIAKI
jgi:hypothetical protein